MKILNLRIRNVSLGKCYGLEKNIRRLVTRSNPPKNLNITIKGQKPLILNGKKKYFNSGRIQGYIVTMHQNFLLGLFDIIKQVQNKKIQKNARAFA